jgi:hypothetical protein
MSISKEEFDAVVNALLVQIKKLQGELFLTTEALEDSVSPDELEAVVEGYRGLNAKTMEEFEALQEEYNALESELQSERQQSRASLNALRVEQQYSMKLQAELAELKKKEEKPAEEPTIQQTA